MAAPAVPRVRMRVYDLTGLDLSGATGFSTLFSWNTTRLPNVNVFVEDLQFGRVTVSSGGASGSPALKGKTGNDITQNFGMEYSSWLVLKDNQPEGLYQIGAANSGLFLVEYRTSDSEPWIEVLKKSADLDMTRFSCGGTIYMKPGVQVNLRIRHVHGTNSHFTTALYLRHNPGNLTESYCGTVGQLFNGSSPTSLLSGILGTEWKAIESMNLNLRADDSNLVKNGSFEDAPSTGNPLPHWSLYEAAEIMSSIGSLNPSSGSRFIELDANAGQAASKPEDAILQYITVETGKRYRYTYDLARRPGYMAPETNQVNMYYVDNGNYNLLRTDSGFSTEGTWRSISATVVPNSTNGRVKLHEPTSSDDSVGSMIDNVRFRKIYESREECNP